MLWWAIAFFGDRSATLMEFMLSRSVVVAMAGPLNPPILGDFELGLTFGINFRPNISAVKFVTRFSIAICG
jgi:hypothetical protein